MKPNRQERRAAEAKTKRVLQAIAARGPGPIEELDDDERQVLFALVYNTAKRFPPEAGGTEHVSECLAELYEWGHLEIRFSPDGEGVTLAPIAETTHH